MCEDLSHFRLLIVDDEHAVLQAAQDYLAAYGFSVDIAAEREEAEALISKRPYAILIVDMRLTGIHGREGFELVRFVREHRPLCRVIVVTGHGSPELEREARRLGADVFLEKPMPLSDLLDAIMRLLSLSQRSWGFGPDA